MTFKDLQLSAPLLKALEEKGYTTPSPIQEKAIPHVLAGKDVLGCAQTGTGKTAAFALPIIQNLMKPSDKKHSKRVIRSLILTPTRELALQIAENFKEYGSHTPVRCAVIFGGVSAVPQIKELQRGIDILVATPGRLNDLIHQGEISLSHVEMFVLDEADRMLDMGFIHDVKKIISLLPVKKQTLLFSATMPPEIQALTEKLLHNPAVVEVTPVSSIVDLIEDSLYYVDKENKRALLVHLLKREAITSTLVFTRTKHGADRIAKFLTKNRINAAAIHGDKSQGARQKALSQFKAGTVRVLAATDIAARGRSRRRGHLLQRHRRKSIRGGYRKADWKKDSGRKRPSVPHDRIHRPPERDEAPAGKEHRKKRCKTSAKKQGCSDGQAPNESFRERLRRQTNRR